ncbi:MAG: hypothetical protein GY841_19155, partial [FCB group bacterium]|nr:hypothetical protein [FCB group bacterium]
SYEQTITVDTTRVFNRHTLSKVGDRYEMTTVTDSTVMSRDGARLADPFAGLFNQVTVVHVIDTLGRAVEVRGYDSLFKMIDDRFEPQMAAGLRSVIDPEMLTAGELDEWNSSLGELVDLELSAGEPVLTSDAITLPSGINVRLFQAVELIDTATLEGVPCARVQVVVHSNPAELAAMIGQSNESVVGYFQLNDSVVEAINLSPITSRTHTELVVEIATMLVRSNQSSREMEMSAVSPEGVASRGALVETQHKLYFY